MKRYYIATTIVLLPLFILGIIFPKDIIGLLIYCIYVFFIAIPFIAYNKWMNKD